MHGRELSDSQQYGECMGYPFVPMAPPAMSEIRPVCLASDN